MTEAENAVAIVKEFLVASMIPDAERRNVYAPGGENYLHRRPGDGGRGRYRAV